MAEDAEDDVFSFFEERDEAEEDDMPFHWLEGDSLAPPCQSETEVVKDILRMAELTKDDVLFDLGCGDGRICIAAAEKYGARAAGVEIEDHLIKKFHTAVAARGVSDRVQVCSLPLKSLVTEL